MIRYKGYKATCKWQKWW